MSDEQELDTGREGRERDYTPSYVPIQTLMSFLESLDPKAIPRRIDRSMMPSYSGGAKRKLMSALTFLGLIRPGGEATERLHELVRTRDDPEQHKVSLANTIQQAYATIIGDLDVGTASLKQLADAFKTAGVEGTTLHEAIRFYVKARQAAGLPVSKYIADGKIGTVGNGTKIRPKRGDTARQQTESEAVSAPEVSGKASSRPSQSPMSPEEGTIDFPIYFKGKPKGTIRVPADLSEQDCKVIELTLAVLRAYAEQGGGTQTH